MISNLNTMKKIFLPLSLLFLLVVVSCTPKNAQNGAQASSKVQKMEIKTSAVCGMCEGTLEKALYKVDGVRKISLDVGSKMLSVMYNDGKTNPEAIKKAITLTGYDADDMPADEVAYENLHACCKKDAHD